MEAENGAGPSPSPPSSKPDLDPCPGPQSEPRDGLCAPVPGQSDEVLVTINSDALMVASPEGEAAGRKGPDPQLWNSSYLERHRRKRITQSCSMLCRLLPTIQGSHVDMVTVLEMTVALLETVQEVVPAEDPNIQLCPPTALHAHWLSESQKIREAGHKMAADQKQRKVNRVSNSSGRQGGASLMEAKKRSRRRTDGD